MTKLQETRLGAKGVRYPWAQNFDPQAQPLPARTYDLEPGRARALVDRVTWQQGAINLVRVESFPKYGESIVIWYLERSGKRGITRKRISEEEARYLSQQYGL